MKNRSPSCKSRSQLVYSASELRQIVSERIARNLEAIQLEQESLRNVLSEFGEYIRYLPVEDPTTTILLTHSTLHCLLRLLACVVDCRLRQKNPPTIDNIRERIGEIGRVANLEPILRPFADPKLECLRKDELKKAYELIKPLSSFECLLLMGILYERSHWEFVVYSKDNSSSSARTQIYTNLNFSNRKGIFYTSPEIASFIVDKTFEKSLNERLNLMVSEDPSNLKTKLDTLLESKVCDPACGSSIFLLYFLKTIYTVLQKILEVAHKNNIEIERMDILRKQILKNMIYGVDIEEEAVQLSFVLTALLAGASLDELPSYKTKFKVGNSLVSEEILGSPLKPKKKKEKRSLKSLFQNGKKIRAFNWSEEYPELDFYHEAGGFDYIFLNPPYGRLKVHGSDFTDKETLSGFSEEELEKELFETKKSLRNFSDYVRKSGDYRISCKGELDWYRLMIERSLRLLKKGGRLGCIIPSTILADVRSSLIRKYLLEDCTIEQIVYLPETARLFDTVNQTTCILILEKESKQQTSINIAKCQKPYELQHIEFITIPIDLIRKLDPSLLPIPIIGQDGSHILGKIYQNRTIGNNPHIKNMRGELDLTAHKDYLSSDEEDLSLIRGDNVERFRLRTNVESRKKARVKRDFLNELTEDRLSHIKVRRIVGRQCSYLRKKRRLSFAIVESGSIVSNSCNYLVSTDLDDFPLDYILGIMNSNLFEWRFRITSSNNHVGNYEIDQLAMPPRQEHLVLSKVISETVKKLRDHYSTLRFGASKIPSGDNEDYLEAAVFLIYGISEDDVKIVLKDTSSLQRLSSIIEKMRLIDASIIYDHIAASPSEREKEMIKHIPPGGNWQDIPTSIPSKRLEQIRRMTKERGGIVRTTYYGRLSWDRLAYTISTYFSRIGNGCFIHPEQDRLISLREAARLQSFRDCFKFYGSRTSKYKMIGNAVPPLLAMAIAETIGGRTLVAPFCGAGGLSEGFRMAGYRILAAQDIDKYSLMTYMMNGLCHSVISGDIRDSQIMSRFVESAKNVANGEPIDVVAAGPPCTGFSLAGWYRKDDPKNELVYCFLRIVDELEPKYVVMENVQGLIWMDRGRVLDDIIKAIDDLGYEVDYKVLKAEQFGVPQLRRRVIILGSNAGKPKFPRPLFGETGLDMRRIFTVRDAISDLVNIFPDRKINEHNYREEWVETDYQSWCRGLLSTEELFKRREFPWVNR